MTTYNAIRGLLVLCLLVLIVAALCLLLCGAEGVFSQRERGLLLAVAVLMLPPLMGARG